jgi:Xaa-Pro aminopeptidase
LKVHKYPLNPILRPSISWVVLLDKILNRVYSIQRFRYEFCGDFALRGLKMSQFMFENRLSSLRNKFDILGVDAVWIIQPENRRYLSSFKAADGQLNESSGSLFITLEKAFLLTDSRYTIQAQEEAVGFEVITHKEGLTNALSHILDLLNARRLGFEGGYMIWDIYQKATEKASQHSPPVELIPLAGLVEEMREIKEPEELEALSRSAQLMGDVLARIIEELRPGLLEKDVAWRIETLIREMDTDGVAFPPIVASGPNSALPHAALTNRTVKGSGGTSFSNRVYKAWNENYRGRFYCQGYYKKGWV